MLSWFLYILDQWLSIRQTLGYCGRRTGVDFICLIEAFLYRQADDECGTMAQFTLYGDGSVVQLHQVMNQREANARANGIELAVASFIETLEQVFLNFV